MKSVVRRWGMNLAIRIPPEVTKQMKLKEDQEVELQVVDGKIVVAPLAKVIPIKKEA